MYVLGILGQGKKTMYRVPYAERITQERYSDPGTVRRHDSADGIMILASGSRQAEGRPAISMEGGEIPMERSASRHLSASLFSLMTRPQAWRYDNAGIVK